MSSRFAQLLLSSVLPVLAGAACAQAQTQTPDRQMTLSVVVLDKSGKPVPGLQQQDFTLLDDKHPQKIVSFQAVQGVNPSGPPTQIILVIDQVNTALSNVAFERQQVQKFAERDGGQLARPLSLAVFTDTGVRMSGAPTQDGKAVVAALGENPAGLRVINRDQGVYGAGDRLQLSINALRQIAESEVAQPGQKILIWISPGWPYLTGPNIILSSKDQQNLFNTLVAVSDLMAQARITLDSVDPLGTADAAGFRSTYYQEFVKGVKKPQQMQMGNLALQALAIQSGGRVFIGSNDVANEIAKAATEANDYYLLTFDAARGDGPNEYHSLEVKVGRPGLKAQTRTGYYAQP